MIKGEDITEEGYARLCAAVIRMAVKDYAYLCKRIDEAKSRGRKPTLRDQYEKNKLESFFRSDRFHLYAGNVEFDYLADKIPELRSVNKNEK